MALGFAPYHGWPVIFISLPVLYLMLAASCSYRQAALRAFLFGYGYSMAGTWWIANALLVDGDKFAWMVPFSVLGLSAVMALWFGVLGILAYALRRRMGILLFAMLWVLVELARSVGIFGFPWNLLGYMSLASLPLGQGAALFGTYGLSALLAWAGLLPALYAVRLSRRKKIAHGLLVLACIGAVYGYGAARLGQPTTFTPTMLRLVQPNVPQSVKGSHEGQVIARDSLARLSTQRTQGTAPDVVIWPETSYPFTLREQDGNSLPPLSLVITGAVRAEGYPPHVKIWNSLVAMNGSGEVLETYDKHQLVPFGEFVPLRHLLPLEKITPGSLDFSRGSGPRTLTLSNLPPFSPLICYEGIFPSMAIDTAHRPAWLLNLTNDAWYGNSPGPYQHFDMVRMRAIEQGLPMVRVANSGISAVIDSYGRVVDSLPLNAQGILDVKLPAPVAGTLYAHYNELMLLLVLFCLIIFAKFRSPLDQI